jgi:phasin family protein
MMQNFEEAQKKSKENLDKSMKAVGVLSKGMQEIAVDATDYAKKSMEESTSTMEKLMSAKSLDKAIEIQSTYAKSAYENAVGATTKMNDKFMSLMKEAMKPYEEMMPKAAK